MRTLKDLKAELMQDEEFKKEYIAIQSELDDIRKHPKTPVRQYPQE